MPKLTSKQARFVEEYLTDLNATQAAIRAGYRQQHAGIIGYENLTKPYIRDAIEAAQRERSARTGITADRVVQEIARVALANLSDVLSWDSDGVVLKSSTDISADATAAISEITDTRSELGGMVRVKLHNKVAALEQLAKHVGLYHDRASPAAADAIVLYLPDNGR